MKHKESLVNIGNQIHCRHQWFELKKILKASKKEQAERDNRPPTEVYYIDIDDVYGVLIKCANCKKQKELWMDMDEE